MASPLAAMLSLRARGGGAWLSAGVLRQAPLAHSLRRLSTDRTGGNSSADAGSDTDAGEMDEYVGVHRASHRVALRSRAPGRFTGSFRGRNDPPPYHGPIARLSNARPHGGEPEPVVVEYESSLRKLYAGADGCLGAHLLWDPVKGEATSFTVWASAGHLSALTETADYGDTMKRFGQLLVGVPEVTTLRVLASVTREPAPATPSSDDGGDAAAGGT
jgi:hypothetical protein